MGVGVLRSVPMMSIRLVWPFVMLGEKAGRDVSGIARALGLTAAQYDDPDTRVSQAVLARLLERAVARTGQRDLGLLAARQVDSGHFGVSEYVARTCATLQAAIELTERYLPLLCEGAGLAIERTTQHWIASFRFSPELAIHEAAYEFAIAIAVLRARRTTRIADLAPCEVRFTHAKPADTTAHDALFRCPIRFGADVTQVVMSSEFLAMRLPGADPVLSDLLVVQADAMLRRMPRARDMNGCVRTLLTGESDLRHASITHLAARLGVSPRTLSRKLEEEGTNYRALINEVRRDAARHALACSVTSISEVAYQLGFASRQGFARAFRRWTATTPEQYRRRSQRPRRVANVR